jgi:hypothetical protein
MRLRSEKFDDDDNNNNNNLSLIPPTHFDLYKVIIREIYTKAHEYSKFCVRPACVDNIVFNSIRGHLRLNFLN